jgi:hypothetical protein
MGNAKTEAKKRERDRLKGRPAKSLWTSPRADKLKAMLAVELRDARRVDRLELTPDCGGVWFVRAVLAPSCKPLARFWYSVGLADMRNRTDESVIDEVKAATTRLMREYLDSPRGVECVRSAIDAEFSEQLGRP